MRAERLEAADAKRGDRSRFHQVTQAPAPVVAPVPAKPAAPKGGLSSGLVGDQCTHANQCSADLDCLNERCGHR